MNTHKSKLQTHTDKEPTYEQAPTIESARNINNGAVINARYHRHPMEFTVARAKTTAKIEPKAQNN